MTASASSLTIGFLGAGQMATALAKGFLAAGRIAPQNLTACDVLPAATDRSAAGWRRDCRLMISRRGHAGHDPAKYMPNELLERYMAEKDPVKNFQEYLLAEGVVTKKPHQAHYQSLDYNPVHGGIARWFEPIEARIGCQRRQFRRRAPGARGID